MCCNKWTAAIKYRAANFWEKLKMKLLQRYLNTFLVAVRASRWTSTCAFLLAATLAGVSPSMAQTGETKVVRIVVPFAAGSYTDNFARIVIPGFAERLGMPVVIDNRPGANGVIAADYVAKSSPDGLTLLLGGTSSIAINPGIYKSLPYDPIKDLLPVVRSGSLPFVLIVHPSVPANTVLELIEYAKKYPGKLAYATPNSSSLMGMEMFKRLASVDILSVPYKSSPQAMLDLIGNQVQVQIADYATAIPHIRSGKVRLLAVTMDQRSLLLPSVPTVAEVLKGFDVSAWNGLFAARGTSLEVATRISDAWQGVLAVKGVQERLSVMGFDVIPLGHKAFGPYVRDQIDSWGKLAREAGVKAE